MRSLSQYLPAPAAVAEDWERRSLGSAWGARSDVSCEPPNPFPAQSTPAPVRVEVHARCPGRTLRIVRTRPVEAHSSVKISLRESGLRPLPYPSSQNQQELLPRRSHPGKNSGRTGESTTPRHLVFACESRLPEDAHSLKIDSTSRLWEGCGIRSLLWIAEENTTSKSGTRHAQKKPGRDSHRAHKLHPRSSAQIRGSILLLAQRASAASLLRPCSPGSIRAIFCSE